MWTGLAQHANKVAFLMKHHSPAILTGVGVAGTVATAYLTGRASLKAARLIDMEIATRAGDSVAEGATDFQHPSRTEKVKLVWKLYVTPFAVGTITVVSIFMANRISSKRLAALTIASGITERAFQEYKDKIAEKFGDRENTKIRDEIAQDRVSADSPESREVIITGRGEVLCYDMLTGRYFESTVENIKQAENKINFELLRHSYASLSEFFDYIGLPPTALTDTLGWGSLERVDVELSTTMSPDERPCIAIDFKTRPVTGYDKFGYT